MSNFILKEALMLKMLEVRGRGGYGEDEDDE
jgi:hypothetical protein